jgi:phosphohistidine phosphatase SixA
MAARNAADIDLVVCSSATRARQTWKLVAKQLDNIPRRVSMIVCTRRRYAVC